MTGAYATRRIAAALVLGVGGFWLIGTLTLSYPHKTQAVDNLTSSFRPVFTNAGIHQSKTDIATLNAFASQFQNTAVPQLARQLNIPPQQLIATLSNQYPDVGKALQQLPTSLPYFNTMVSDLAAQQQNFHRLDAIPTKTIAATSVTWLFVMLGVIVISLAAIMLVKPAWARAPFIAAAVLGVGVVVISLVLSVPTKTRAVDDLTNTFRPVFTTQGAAQTRAYLATVQAMDKQLTAEALPGLASLLKVTPAQLTASMATGSPAVATGLQQMPQILDRFDVLVTKIENNITNFALADSIPSKGTPTTLLEWQLVAPAALLILAGGLGIAVPAPTRRRSAALAARRSPSPVPGALASEPRAD